MVTLLQSLFGSRRKSTKRSTKRSTIQHNNNLPFYPFHMPMMTLRPTMTRSGPYESIQRHVEIVNGTKQEKIQTVSIHGNKGTKKVTLIQDGKKKTHEKPLTRKQIACIRKCQRIPGLFNDCEEKCT